MEKVNIESVVRDIQYFFVYGIHSDEDLEYVEKWTNALKEIRDKGESPYSDIDEIIDQGETAVERRISYLEKVASLGNNWW